MHHVCIGHTDNAIACPSEKAISKLVALLSARNVVRVTVNLDDEPGAVAAEVDIVSAADFDLAPEVMP